MSPMVFQYLLCEPWTPELPEANRPIASLVHAFWGRAVAPN